MTKAKNLNEDKIYYETRISDSEFEDSSYENNLYDGSDSIAESLLETEEREDKNRKIEKNKKHIHTKNTSIRDFSYGVLNKLNKTFKQHKSTSPIVEHIHHKKNKDTQESIQEKRSILEGREIRYAVRENNKDKVLSMIKSGYLVNDFQKASLACIASRRKNLEILKILIEAGIDINQADKRSQKTKSRIALQEAARKGWYDGVLILLQMNSVIDYCDNNDLTALHLASRYHYHSKNKGNKNPNTLLKIQNDQLNREKIVKLLLDCGASPNGSDKSKYSPLYETSSLHITKMLIEYGAEVNPCSYPNKYNPLHFQVYNGNQEIVKLLIKLKANINSKDYKKRTPLFFISHRGNPIDTYQVLKNNNEVQFHIRDIGGNNFIHSLAKHISNVDLLKQTMEDFTELWEKKNNDGKTPKNILKDRGLGHYLK